VGLETYLGAAALVGVARYAAAGRPDLTGVLCGLAVLCRPDLAVPGAVLALVLKHKHGSRRRASPAQPAARLAGARRSLALAGLVVATAAALALPWHLFSWFALGGFVPDTLWLKTLEPSFGVGGPTMLTAPATLYAAHWPVATALTALPVALGVCAAGWVVRWWRQPGPQLVLALLAAGWAHYVAMVAIGATPYAWYFAPLVACSTVAVAVAAAYLSPRPTAISTVVLTALCLATAGPMPWDTPPIYGNIATTAQYATIGSQLAPLTHGQPVAGPGEVGDLAFYSSVPVVDAYGDRAVAKPYLDQRYQHAGLMLRAFLRWNWAHRIDPPPPKLRYRLSYASLGLPPGRVVASWPIVTPTRTTPDQVVLTED